MPGILHGVKSAGWSIYHQGTSFRLIITRHNFPLSNDRGKSFWGERQFSSNRGQWNLYEIFKRREDLLLLDFSFSFLSSKIQSTTMGYFLSFVPDKLVPCKKRSTDSWNTILIFKNVSISLSPIISKFRFDWDGFDKSMSFYCWHITVT